MALVDGRPGTGGGGGVSSVNGDPGPNVIITAASIGAESAPVVQGSPGAPVLVTNLTPVALDASNNEIIYLAGNGGPFMIDLANFSGVKPEGKYLKIVVRGAFALSFTAGGNFVMNGDRRCVANSILNFFCNGATYTEDGGNEIA